MVDLNPAQDEPEVGHLREELEAVEIESVTHAERKRLNAGGGLSHRLEAGAASAAAHGSAGSDGGAGRAAGGGGGGGGGGDASSQRGGDGGGDAKGSHLDYVFDEDFFCLWWSCAWWWGNTKREAAD